MQLLTNIGSRLGYYDSTIKIDPITGVEVESHEGVVLFLFTDGIKSVIVPIIDIEKTLLSVEEYQKIIKYFATLGSFPDLPSTVYWIVLPILKLFIVNNLISKNLWTDIVIDAIKPPDDDALEILSGIQDSYILYRSYTSNYYSYRSLFESTTNISNWHQGLLTHSIMKNLANKFPTPYISYVLHAQKVDNRKYFNIQTAIDDNEIKITKHKELDTIKSGQKEDLVNISFDKTINIIKVAGLGDENKYPSDRINNARQFYDIINRSL